MQLSGARISTNFLTVLGVQPRIGRAFVSGEEVPGSSRVVLLSDALWRGRFGADERIIGRSITLDGSPNTVIGVIATNARLPHLFALANAAQDGLATAVRPAHGLTDGDTVFAATTGTHDAADPHEVLAAARRVFARALVHGLLRAESATTSWGRLAAYRELYPRTAAEYRGN